MSDATGKGREGAGFERPRGSYWEDPVYQYVSRRHRSAVASGDGSEAVRFDGLMQELVNGSMPDALYQQLDGEAKAERRKRQEERKRRRKPPQTRALLVERAPSANVAELKKRIFNPQVSRENVIKALEALPAGERKATIVTLPPGLRRKLGEYLKGGGH